LRHEWRHDADTGRYGEPPSGTVRVQLFDPANQPVFAAPLTAQAGEPRL